MDACVLLDRVLSLSDVAEAIFKGLKAYLYKFVDKAALTVSVQLKKAQL